MTEHDLPELDKFLEEPYYREVEIEQDRLEAWEDQQADRWREAEFIS